MSVSLVYELNDLPKVANELWKELQKKPVMAFYGAMGVGKTTLIKAICAIAGVQNTVVSPTFALINEYVCSDGKPLFHFDFYRINQPKEAFDFGYEEYFYGGNICLIEWPEKIRDLLPENTLHVHIRELPNGQREITY